MNRWPKVLLVRCVCGGGGKGEVRCVGGEGGGKVCVGGEGGGKVCGREGGHGDTLWTLLTCTPQCILHKDVPFKSVYRIGLLQYAG